MPFRKCTMCGREVDAFTLVDHPNALTNALLGGICQSCANTIKEQKRQEERYQEEQKRRERDQREREQRERDQREREQRKQDQREPGTIEKKPDEINNQTMERFDTIKEQLETITVRIRSIFDTVEPGLADLRQNFAFFREYLEVKLQSEVSTDYFDQLIRIRDRIFKESESFSKKTVILLKIDDPRSWFVAGGKMMRDLATLSKVDLKQIEYKTDLRPKDIAGILTTISEKSLLSMTDRSESNLLSEPLQMLCDAAITSEIDWIIGEGPGARSIRIPIPSFHLLLASRNEQTLEAYKQTLKSFGEPELLIEESI